MIKKLLPVILILVGGGAGVGAGLVLQPTPEPELAAEDSAGDSDAEKQPENEENEPEEKEGAPEPDTEIVSDGDGDSESAGSNRFAYVKLNNQFVLPIVKSDIVTALVVMNLSLEVEPGSTELMYSIEPRIRDALLRALFDHAAAGGFDGAFANNYNLSILRRKLRDQAYNVIGPLINDVLITDIARQDI